MSHRTNYALRDGGTVRFGTDRSGGTAIPDLLVGGEAETRAVLDAIAPAGADALYDEGVCEGLVLLDADERTVLFDGVSELMYEGAMRRVWGPVLRARWPGWRLLHTPEPVRHLGEHLGLSAAWLAAKASPPPTSPTTGPLPTWAPDVIADPQTEILWRTASGAWRQAVVDVEPGAVLARGPGVLDGLDTTPTVPARDRLAPWGLVRADAGRRRLAVWTDLPTYRLGAEAGRLWPGWAVTELTLRGAARLSRLGDRFHPTAEDIARATAAIRNRLGHRLGRRFAHALAEGRMPP